MNLKTSQYVFIITASQKLEDRFLYDIECGILLLSKSGVPSSQFTIVADENRSVFESKCPCFRNVNFISSDVLLDFLRTVDVDGLFIISSCHGSMVGIDSKHNIEPSPFTEALKSNKRLENVVVVFGQCYAGIFNYLELDNTKIVYLGVTDIDYGYSIPQKTSVRSWLANVPVLYSFLWLANPIDVDKDGYASIVDLYKYVTFQTNQVIHDSEKRYSQLLVDAVKSSQALLTPDDDNMQQLYHDAMQSLSDYNLVRQNTWILNTKSANNMFVNL